MAFEDDSSTIACAHCGHTIYAQARFCRRCGNTPKSAPPTCAKCGAVAEATDALFCSECGAALASLAPDSETRPLSVATPVRRSAPVEPLPLSSLPEGPTRKTWLWVLGFVILAASAIAGVTHPDKLTNWLRVPASQQTRPPMKAMEAAISAYYDAIGNQDFKTAYSLWTPAMQKGLTPNDLANQWSDLGADGAQVHLDVTTFEPPDGDFVPTTVTETTSYPGGYVRKQVLKGGWHVVNIDGRWLLNERDFKTVADNGPPPTSPVNDGIGGSSQASNAGGSGESGTPSSEPQGASSEAGTEGSALPSSSGADRAIAIAKRHYGETLAGLIGGFNELGNHRTVRWSAEQDHDSVWLVYADASSSLDQTIFGFKVDISDGDALQVSGPDISGFGN